MPHSTPTNRFEPSIAHFSCLGTSLLRVEGARGPHRLASSAGGRIQTVALPRQRGLPLPQDRPPLAGGDLAGARRRAGPCPHGHLASVLARSIGDGPGARPLVAWGCLRPQLPARWRAFPSRERVLRCGDRGWRDASDRGQPTPRPAPRSHGGMRRVQHRHCPVDRQGIGIDERTRVVAALYAGILRVHPFADGNHRTAFVALSAALWSLGLPAVEFADNKDMTDHDSAVAPALISPDGDVEPFARLLATRIEHARNPAT